MILPGGVRPVLQRVRKADDAAARRRDRIAVRVLPAVVAGTEMDVVIPPDLPAGRNLGRVIDRTSAVPDLADRPNPPPAAPCRPPAPRRPVPAPSAPTGADRAVRPFFPPPASLPSGRDAVFFVFRAWRGNGKGKQEKSNGSNRYFREVVHGRARGIAYARGIPRVRV